MARMSISTAAGSATYRLRRKLPDNVVGNALFSLGMVARVPYFGTILPYVSEMEPGRCVVSAPKWFGIHNHIGTFHAIAACNLAEVAMGMLMEATTPTTHRWIPKGMSAQYLTKANTRLTATATLAHPIDFATITEGTDVVVSIEIRDTDGIEVVHCDITTWVTPA
jgi:acyl-coenzyme A thioesterase PaaI-like protein